MNDSRGLVEGLVDQCGRWVLITERGGYGLWRREQDGLWTVTRIDRDRGQVYNAIPGDRPKEGGAWYGKISSAGVGYVASGYSEGYARKIFRRCAGKAERG